jgi:hypothetical protein
MEGRRMSQISELPYVIIPPIKFKCKHPECKNGEATYRFEVIAIARGRNIQKIKPDIMDVMTQARAVCQLANHRETYNVIFFPCKKTDCNEVVLGTDEKGCTDSTRIFADGKAKLKCIKGHENPYSL